MKLQVAKWGNSLAVRLPIEQDFGVRSQYCSFKQNSVRPEPVEGLLVSSWWFDKLTTKVNRTALGQVFRYHMLLKDPSPISAHQLRWPAENQRFQARITPLKT
ncbi:hypothetical protein [Thiobacillus denitrificans]|uniref:AbrB/MazE/SpoVT family DNA-binding domain-containing protein n=1 Tax=Thiobacillus denitrificans TaxID=36861 RepID=UPI0012F7A46F|nr:hypothetical protein [Thiobacillus denitrificans]